MDSGQIITDMVDDLLNVSRIQTGKVNYEAGGGEGQPILLKDRLAMVQEESTNKHEFVIDIEPDLPEALVDRDKFGQVIGQSSEQCYQVQPQWRPHHPFGLERSCSSTV